VGEDVLAGALPLRHYLSDRNLGGEFHDLVFDGRTMDDDEFLRTMRPARDLAREPGLAYLCTLIEKDGVIRLVIDSPGGAEVAARTAGDPFLHPYGGPPDALRTAFAIGRTTFANCADEYCEFRSVFAPLQTPGGRLECDPVRWRLAHSA
jgi:hypothetical protein